MHLPENRAGILTENGVALISMLLVLAIVTALCTQMLMKNRLELRKTQALIRTAQAEQMVFSGLAYGEVLLLDYTQADKSGRQKKAGDVVPAEEQVSTLPSRNLAYFKIMGGAPLPEPEDNDGEVSVVDPYWPFAGDAQEFYVLLEDEQGKFNLNNLVNSNGKVNEAQLKVFQRLLVALDVEPELALNIADWIDLDRNPIAYNSEDFAYLQQAVAYRTANRPVSYWKQIISVRGVRQETLEKLYAYVTAIPGPSPVNLNSASSLLLEAMVPGIDGDSLLEAREAQGGYSSVSEFGKSTLTAGLKMNASLFSVESAFFAITAYCKLDGYESSWQTLVERVDRKKKSKEPLLHTLWMRQLPFWELGLSITQESVELENE